jgi:hypothetical protein
MPQPIDGWLRYQQHRWRRPDAARWLRPDAARFLKPGTELSEVYPWLRTPEAKGRLDQPRVPSGNRYGGRWTRDGAGGGRSAGSDGASSISDGASGGEGEMLPEIEVVASSEPASGFDLISGLSSLLGGVAEFLASLDDAPPEIPKREPATRKGRMGFVRSAAAWIARIGRRMFIVDIFFSALDQIQEIERLASMIKTANDPPQDFDEAQRRVASPAEQGYQNHHIVNQHDENRKKFGDARIDSINNQVRIPTLQHIELSRWYATKNKAFNFLSPQDSLRDKSWDEQTQVGRDILRELRIIK